MQKKLNVYQRGLVDYNKAYQEQIVLREKVRIQECEPFQLYICEHDPVITKGRNFMKESLLYDEEVYEQKGVLLVETDRGGDITFHGKGQITAYFIFDLNFLIKDIHWFIHQLEEVVINVLRKFGVEGSRNPINSGVWIGNSKICAIGVGFKHWISYHGIGFNINTDMKYFDMIVPCGLKGTGVTSLSQVLNKTEISISMVIAILMQSTQEVFGFSECVIREFSI